MIKIKCCYCGKETYKFYCCQFENSEAYCCEDCAKKYEDMDGPYIANISRFYDNTAPLTSEEKEKLEYYHMNFFQKIKYRFSKLTGVK